MAIFPLCDEQKYLFDVNETIPGIPANISFTLTFSKFFSADELRCAVEKCLLPADISGARCVIKGGQPHMEFMPSERLEISVHRFASTEDFEQFCEKVAASKINNRDKLYYITIYTIADSFNHLYFCFNHIIFDAISGLLLTRSILNFLLGEQKQINLHPFSAHLERIDRYTKSDKYLADQEFWERRFAEISQCDYLFSDAIDIEVASSKEMAFQSSQSFKRSLLEFCAQQKISSALLIATVFAELMHIKTGRARFYFEVPIANRLEAKEKESMGVYEIGPPIIVDFHKYCSLVEQLDSMQKQLRDYHEHKDFDWNKRIFSQPYIEKYGNYCPQLLYSHFSHHKNYSAPFVKIRHLKGNISFLPFTFYVSNYIDYDALTFSYVFWDKYFSSDEINDLHQRIESRINQIVEQGVAQVALKKP